MDLPLLSSSSSSTMLNEQQDVADLLQQLVAANADLSKRATKLGSSEDTSSFRKKLAKKRQDTQELCKKIHRLCKTNEAGGGAANPLVMKKLERQFKEEVAKFQKISETVIKSERSTLERMSASNKDDSPLSETGEQDQAVSHHQISVATNETIAEAERMHADIMQVERDVTELHEMFRDLAFLVDKQQEQLDIVENNIMTAKEDTKAGHVDIVKAADYQDTARRRQCYILICCLVIIGIIVGVSVGTLKKA